jgi:hypothetical protein
VSGDIERRALFVRSERATAYGASGDKVGLLDARALVQVGEVEQLLPRRVHRLGRKA